MLLVKLAPLLSAPPLASCRYGITSSSLSCRRNTRSPRLCKIESVHATPPPLAVQLSSLPTSTRLAMSSAASRSLSASSELTCSESALLRKPPTTASAGKVCPQLPSIPNRSCTVLSYCSGVSRHSLRSPTCTLLQSTCVGLPVMGGAPAAEPPAAGAPLALLPAPPPGFIRSRAEGSELHALTATKTAVPTSRNAFLPDS